MTLPTRRKVLFQGLVPGGSPREALLHGLVLEEDAPVGDDVTRFPALLPRRRPRRLRRRDEEMLLLMQ